jgi:hypothetical protein
MSKESPTNNLLVEISSKLDKVLKLLAIDAVKDFEKEQQKIELLDSIGFKPSEIAKFLNKSPENVSVVLGSIRKKKEPKQNNSAKVDESKVGEAIVAKAGTETKA